MTKLHLDLGTRGYDVNIGRGLISRAGELFSLGHRVFILTDSGVPKEYARTVASQCQSSMIYTVEAGEGAKSPEVYLSVLDAMLKFGMTRSDCLVAVGGGVVGDLGGFCAASYMRGIDFYNIPTTLLSQVDSSIGGKVGINFKGVKNIVGAFHQPKGVIVDPDTLKTLSKRHISNGLAEAVKMALTSDAELFSLFEEGVNEDNLERIITSSLMIKKQVVEDDEKETGLRRILNFGHTFGHAVEAEEEMQGLYHGECVALGMLVTASYDVKKRLIPVLESLELPTKYTGDIEKAIGFIHHDKKCDGGLISVVFVDKIGSYRIEKISTEDFVTLVKERI